MYRERVWQPQRANAGWLGGGSVARDCCTCRRWMRAAFPLGLTAECTLRLPIPTCAATFWATPSASPVKSLAVTLNLANSACSLHGWPFPLAFVKLLDHSIPCLISHHLQQIMLPGWQRLEGGGYECSNLPPSLASAALSRISELFPKVVTFFQV